MTKKHTRSSRSSTELSPMTAKKFMNDELVLEITQPIIENPELRQQLISLFLSSTAATTANHMDDSSEEQKVKNDVDWSGLIVTKAGEIGTLLASTVENIFSERIDNLEERLDLVENELKGARRYSRSFNIRIYGMGDTPKETPLQTKAKVDNFFSTQFGLTFQHGIEFCHRLQSSIPNKPCPIIARLYSRLERQQILSSLGKIKGKNLGITAFDDLTVNSLAIFKRERTRLKDDDTKRVIPRQGKIFIQNEDDRSVLK
ncbi:unnamed protein product [Didymodactylos carnosus]|uniref:Uncharacterized protein n=1 Tax=Didymodactylos carnosus TaxID=1234261 RepID=A0A815BGC0_9BILA|nr:unnamed protein product [Didymodactylos carnosus]CAF4056667.1 unnamed protein product [Didymodactylos carnosus]